MIYTKLLTENMKMAFATIRTHKVRSFLTVLGVVIGVTVAIVVSSVLLGLENNIQSELNDFGINNLFVFKFDVGFHFGRLTPEERARKSLTYDHGMAIKDQVPGIMQVSFKPFPRLAHRPHPLPTPRSTS